MQPYPVQAAITRIPSSKQTVAHGNPKLEQYSTILPPFLPTKCNKLVADWPDYVGIKDTSKHGVGGIIIGEQHTCTLTVFHLEWPDDIKQDIHTGDNPTVCLTNLDLEMGGLLLLWLVMEDVCQLSTGCHVVLFIYNSSTVSWVKRLASKVSLVAAHLLRALTLWLKVKQMSLLMPFHVSGCENSMTDTSSRSWGSEPRWHCCTDADLRLLFNTTFPLPN